jgi:hypothetical protein
LLDELFSYLDMPIVYCIVDSVIQGILVVIESNKSILDPKCTLGKRFLTDEDNQVNHD